MFMYAYRLASSTTKPELSIANAVSRKVWMENSCDVNALYVKMCSLGEDGTRAAQGLWGNRTPFATRSQRRSCKLLAGRGEDPELESWVVNVCAKASARAVKHSWSNACIMQGTVLRFSDNSHSTYVLYKPDTDNVPDARSVPGHIQAFCCITFQGQGANTYDEVHALVKRFSFASLQGAQQSQRHASIRADAPTEFVPMNNVQAQLCIAPTVTANNDTVFDIMIAKKFIYE